MQVLSPAIIWIIFGHCIHNTLTLWNKVTLKKSTDTEFTLFDIWTLDVGTTAQHRSSPSARLMQSKPSNSTTSISNVLLSFHVQLVLPNVLLHSGFLTNSFSEYFTAPIQVTFPTHPHLSHAPKSIKLTQTLLDGRLWCHNHSKYYCLILFHLSYKQKSHRILRAVVQVSTILPQHHQVAIDKQTTLKHYTSKLSKELLILVWAWPFLSGDSLKDSHQMYDTVLPTQAAQYCIYYYEYYLFLGWDAVQYGRHGQHSH